LESQCLEAILLRGVLNDELDLTKQAIADYDRALDLDRKNIVVYKYKAQAFIKLNQLDKASAILTLAIDLILSSENQKPNFHFDKKSMNSEGDFAILLKERG
jgi:tetratricopeptide (TPR) repeat protein